MEVVRYDRAGKWYLEPRNGTRRQHVNIDQAAQYAVHSDAEIFFNKPGGRAFDRKVIHRKGGR